jgi:membrane protein DedA with SNARE-associated domain
MGKLSPRFRTRLSRSVRWSAFAVLLLVLVVVPFLLLGKRLEPWATAAMQGDEASWTIGIVGGVLLAADVLLPVPSTFVLTVLGTVLGAGAATAVGALGMSVGCVFAYALGRVVEPSVAERFVTAEEQERFAKRIKGHGLLVLAACRGVPILAEASILAAGILRLPVRSVLLTTTAANIGVAGCYALLGASATDGSTFLVAILASLALPALAYAIPGVLRPAGLSAEGRALESLPEDRHVA